MTEIDTDKLRALAEKLHASCDDGLDPDAAYEAGDAILAMADENRRLREALEPFAREAERITPLDFEADRTVTIDDSCEVWQCGSPSFNRSKITYGNLRAARRALGKGIDRV